MISQLRLGLVLGLMLPFTVLLMPIQFMAIMFDLGLARHLPLFWHRLLVRMIGIRVRLNGRLCREGPLLIVANHVSWSDIIILGSLARVCFVAKSEVAKTPFAGLLAHLQRSVFVKREDKRKSGEQAMEIAKRLEQGEIVVLFAEGTTGDGHRVREFKSSLFAAAQFAIKDEHLQPVRIQPVSIAYTRLHGIPTGRFQRGRAAWPGDTALAPHVIEFIRASAWDVTVSCGEPLAFDGSQRRRAVAKQTRQLVSEMYSQSIYGRAS